MNFSYQDGRRIQRDCKVGIKEYDDGVSPR